MSAVADKSKVIGAELGERRAPGHCYTGPNGTICLDEATLTAAMRKADATLRARGKILSLPLDDFELALVLVSLGRNDSDARRAVIRHATDMLTARK